MSSATSVGGSSSEKRRSWDDNGSFFGSTESSKSSKKLSKIEQDLLAIVEEDSSLTVSSDDFTSDPRGVAQQIVLRRKADVVDAVKRIKNKQHVSLAFLVDVTGSMRAHITAVKKQVRDICAQIAAMPPSGMNRDLKRSKVRVAFVGYRDFCDGDDQFEVYPFTTNLDRFEEFVGRLVAHGGGDPPEDVNGGLRMALDSLDWNVCATNVIFHIGDAPPHGHEYTDQTSSKMSLECAKLHDEPIAQIFRRMQSKDIEYYFGKMNNLTDTMLDLFARAYGRPITSFDVEQPIRVTDSISLALMESFTHAFQSSTVRRGERLKSHTLVKEPPDWAAVPVTEVRLVSFKHPSSISDIRKYDHLDRTSRKAFVKIAPSPFAAGSLRFAWYAKELHRLRDGKLPNGVASDKVVDVNSVLYLTDDAVCKSSKIKGKGLHEHCLYASFVETQTIASFLAHAYNDLHSANGTKPTYKIVYLKAKLLVVPNDDGKLFSHYTIEKRLPQSETAWVKVINNAGMTLSAAAKAADKEFFEYLTAFSHWTHAVTRGYLMVTDLQGAKASTNILSSDSEDAERAAEPARKAILLTDPAIHCIAITRFGKTNHGKRGMELFFGSHDCNRFCVVLDLKRAA